MNRIALALAACLATAPAWAAPLSALLPPFHSVPTPAQPGAIALGPPAPHAAPEQWASFGPDMQARNVTEATLQPILPKPGTATGTAIIIAPGGGFMSLSMQNEGWAVAHALAARGIAAFVLKYHLEPTPPDQAAFVRMIMVVFANAAKGTTALPDAATDPAATQDGLAAIALLRQDAKRWGIDPHRISFLGFSAGAILAERLALSPNPTARPDFAGVIYGPLSAQPVPPDAPPLFTAMAADDPLMAHYGLGLVEAWQRAGRPVELHYYEAGGHGFGMRHQGTTSDHWIDQYYAWLAARGLLKH